MACSAFVLLVTTVKMWSNVEEEIQWAAYFDQTRVGLIIAIIVMFCTAVFCFYIAYNPTGGPLGETLYIIGMAPPSENPPYISFVSHNPQSILHHPHTSTPQTPPPSPSPSQKTVYTLYSFPEVKPKVDPFVDGVTGVVDWKDNSSQKYYSENIDITYG